MTPRARFLFETRERPFGVWAGNLRVVEIADARDYPHTEHLGSINMTVDQHADLIAELTGAAAARALHRPCHDPDAFGSSDEICEVDTPIGTHAQRRDESHEWRDPRCRECGKAWPCPTAEVLPR